MFEKILIGNRGEIACRIARTARRLGMKTVAVYSEADAHAKHVREADEAVLLGAAPPRESYLAIDKIIAAAKKTGAQAIHPGYGFLSESAAFRQACDEAGLVFVGPRVEALRVMGSKAEAKKRMQAAGVALAPGYHGDDQEETRLAREAERIGYPVMIKAAAGGGGKGMRRVENPADFAASLASCKREAMANFGDDRMLIEKLFASPRHIEIQIFADSFGDCVSLFERDCSVQRRHQKIVEEAPAPHLSAARRLEMSTAAIKAAKAVSYIGAGTVEFLVEDHGAFYFLEMNTRLQVEHAVTEMIAGIDLVEWQFRVAAGERLPLRQNHIFSRGHALEARIYAEDPARNFLPSVGHIKHLQTPAENAHLRIDAGVDEGDSISSYYDPMIAKVIVWDESREQALARMRRALADFHIVGVANNVAFLSRLVASPPFVNAELDTGLIEREGALLFASDEAPPKEIFLVAALAKILAEAEGNDLRDLLGAGARVSPWQARDHWRAGVGAPRRLVFHCGGRNFELSAGYGETALVLSMAGEKIRVQGQRDERGNMRVDFDGAEMEAAAVADGDVWHIFADGRHWTLNYAAPAQFVEREVFVHGGLSAPMSGRVTALLAQPGATVEKGAPLMILEAMKMEHAIHAPSAGEVKFFCFAVGDQVAEGAELLEFDSSEGA